MIPAKPVDDEREVFHTHDYVKTGRQPSQRSAVISQHRCRIALDEKLLVRDGISETAA
jgi:hypothetical protein